MMREVILLAPKKSSQTDLLWRRPNGDDAVHAARDLSFSGR